MIRKSRAIHKNNKYRIFKPNSLIYNNKNIRNAWPKSPALTVLKVIKPYKRGRSWSLDSSGFKNDVENK
jgi:hypothetical protein